jgi:hypothetical protein
LLVKAKVITVLLYTYDFESTRTSFTMLPGRTLHALYVLMLLLSFYIRLLRLDALLLAKDAIVLQEEECYCSVVTSEKTS